MKRVITLLILVLTALQAQAEQRLDGLQIGTGSAVTIVMFHGDVGNGGDPSNNHAFGAEIARRLPDATVHMLLRPGYSDPWGRSSPGENYGRRDQYTLENAAIISHNLLRLKGNAPLIAVGHSGGAAQLALALSLKEDLVDAAILVGCPCDLGLWQALNPDWPDDTVARSTSPSDALPLPQGPIKIIVGTEDSITPIGLSQSYAQKLTSHNIPHELILVEGGDHSGNRALSTAWLTAIFDARRILVTQSID